MTTPNFILELRRKIGHDPLWLTGVVGYVADEEGRVLLGKRSDNGLWALISGINEPGEQPADTLVREYREETGVDVTVTDMVAVSSERHGRALGNGDQVQFMNCLFLCEVRAGGNSEPSTPDGENSEVGWFRLDALPQPMQPSEAERLEIFQHYLDAKKQGNAHTMFVEGGKLR